MPFLAPTAAPASSAYTVPVLLTDVDAALYPGACGFQHQVTAALIRALQRPELKPILRTAPHIDDGHVRNLEEIFLDLMAAPVLQPPYRDGDFTTQDPLALYHHLVFIQELRAGDYTRSIPANPELVAALRQYPAPIYGYTNGCWPNTRRVLAALGVPNGEIEHILPRTRHFDAMTDPLHVKPSLPGMRARFMEVEAREGPDVPMVFADDSHVNIQAAARIAREDRPNLATIWIKEPHQDWRWGEPRPDIIITQDQYADVLARLSRVRPALTAGAGARYGAALAAQLAL